MSKKLLDHGDLRASVRQEHTELVVVPGPVVADPLSARSLGSLDLGCSFPRRAFLHTHPGQVNRKVVLWLLAQQRVHNGAISRPSRQNDIE